jgi:Lipocalin-like domain
MKQNQNKLNRRGALRRSLQWCVLPLFMATVWSACSQEKKAAADTNPSGTYKLVSVDGNKVPCSLKHEGVTLGVKSGSFVFKPDGTCSTRTVFTPPSGGDVSREVKATYTREGSKLTMKWEGAGTTTGTVQGKSFTMNNEGMVFAYHK